MAVWVEACEAVAAPDPDCLGVVGWVDVSAAVPFTLTEAHLATMGEAFAAGFAIVVMFWALGLGAGYVLKAIRDF